MRIVDVSGFPKDSDKFSLTESIRKILGEGFGWQAEYDARDQITTQLAGVLGPEFVLLRGVLLSGLDTPIPLVLLGPPGVFVLCTSALKGTFRARGDVWLALDTSGNMHPMKPNLPTRTRLYAEAVRKFLLKNGIQVGDIEAVLLFARNDAFVENIKAPIRVVLADGIENYASSLRQSQPSLTPDQVTTIVHLLAGPSAREDDADSEKAAVSITAQAVVMPSSAVSDPEVTASTEDPFGDLFSDRKTARPLAASPAAAPPPDITELEPMTESGLETFLRQAHLTRKQATLLAVFAVLDSCAIIGLLSVALYFYLFRTP
jgi:hypothetical protein